MKRYSLSSIILFIFFGLFIFSDFISAILVLLHLPKITTMASMAMSIIVFFYILFFYKPKFERWLFIPVSLLLLDFILLSINMYRNDQAQHILILFFRQVFYPFVCFCVGITFSKEKIEKIIYNKYFVLIIFSFALFEIIIFNFFSSSFSLILNLFKSEAINIFSFQTSSKGIKLRVSSVFGSALIFSIYMNGCFLYFKDKRMKFLSVILLLLSFNRVGYLAFAFSLLLKYISLKNIKNVVLLITILLSIISIFIGLYSHPFVSTQSDNSFVFKLSTVISRLNGWRFLQDLKEYELFTGMGYLQGFGQKGFVADNLFIYKVLQTGLFGLLLLYLIILFFVNKIKRMDENISILFLSYLPLFVLNLLLFDLMYLVVVYTTLYSSLNNTELIKS